MHFHNTGYQYRYSSLIAAPMVHHGARFGHTYQPLPGLHWENARTIAALKKHVCITSNQEEFVSPEPTNLGLRVNQERSGFVFNMKNKAAYAIPIALHVRSMEAHCK